MDGTIDADEFLIAERLHMTRAQLRDTMPNNEYHQWRAYYVWKATMQELASRDITTPSIRRAR